MVTAKLEGLRMRDESSIKLEKLVPTLTNTKINIKGNSTQKK